MSQTQCVNRRSSRWLTFAVLLCAALLPATAQQKQPAISEDEIKQYFSKARDCEHDDDVSIDSLDYFDFTGEGDEEAVVVASTCATGTAGPDIHSVVRRQHDGSLIELKIPEPTEQQQAVLLCRCFYDLSVDDGRLIETYHDQSGRDDPLVIKLRWNPVGKVFQVAEVKSAPRYKASFDCGKAKTSIENAICYTSSLAELDVALDRSYKRWLDHLNNADSDTLTKEQREWLHRRDLICSVDLDIVHCLTALYGARQVEVEHFRQLHPASAAQ